MQKSAAQPSATVARPPLSPPSSSTPCPTSPRPAAPLELTPQFYALDDADIRQSTVRSALHKAFHLLRRSPFTKAFILTPPTPSDDLNLLASERPSFTISTEENQLGTLSGQIALRYLGIPAFPDTDGLSGGLVVTTYSKRTHPLHHPSVMSDLRVGRYIRDNTTGEWCSITRNNSDGILRLQYIHVNADGIRERIGLTCSINLFDKGQFLESVLYKCHDIEHKVCHKCPQSCYCVSPHSFKLSGPLGLDSVAQAVIREGPNEWTGTVHVTVVSAIYKNNPLLDIDDTMTVHSSYQPSLDKKLANYMRRLAMTDTISQSMNIPAPLTTNNDDDDDSNEVGDQPNLNSSQFSNANPILSVKSANSGSSFDSHFEQDNILGKTPPSVETLCSSLPLTHPSLPLSPLLTTGKPSSKAFGHVANNEDDAIVPSTYPFNDLNIYDVFGGEGVETADHFLIPVDPPVRYSLEEDIGDFPMLPADPSTLPGGIGSCMDGMEVADECDFEDDCFSLMTSERDTGSIASACSTAGSDFAPPVDSVPLPGDDFVDAISALHLSSPHQPATPQPPTRNPKTAGKPKEKWTETTEEDIALGPSVRCMSPINAPLSEPSTRSLETASGESRPKVIKTEDSLEEDNVTSADCDDSSINDAPKEEIADAKVKKEDAVSQSTPAVAPSPITPVAQGAYPVGVYQYRGGSNVPGHMTPMMAPTAMMTPVGGATVMGPMVPAMVPTMNFGQTAMGIPIGMGMGMGMGSYNMGPWVNPGANGTTTAGRVAMPPTGLAPSGGAPPHLVPAGGAAPQLVVDDKTGMMIGVPGLMGIGAPKLAPRPDGVGVAEAKLAWGGMYGNQFLMKARLDAMEKERKAEERRKKNRQAAARSNARKKDLMDGIKSEIQKNKQREGALRRRQELLRKENCALRNRLGR